MTLLAILYIHTNNCPFKENSFIKSWTIDCLEAWHYIRNKLAIEPVIFKVYNVIYILYTVLLTVMLDLKIVDLFLFYFFSLI